MAGRVEDKVAIVTGAAHGIRAGRLPCLLFSGSSGQGYGSHSRLEPVVILAGQRQFIFEVYRSVQTG